MALTAKDLEVLDARFVALLQAVAPGAIAQPATPATPKRGGTTRKTAAPKKTAARKPKTATVPSCITAGDAWIALGGDPSYEPKDLTKPANNAQLWRLNQAGMLSVTQ